MHEENYCPPIILVATSVTSQQLAQTEAMMVKGRGRKRKGKTDRNKETAKPV